MKQLTVEVLPTRIDAEKKAAILLTVGKPPLGMLMLGEWEKDVPYLHSLFVAKGHRRRGLGRLLVQKAVELAASDHKSSLNLWVSKKNKGAIKLYQSEGFVIVGDEDNMMMNHPLAQGAKTFARWRGSLSTRCPKLWERLKDVI